MRKDKSLAKKQKLRGRPTGPGGARVVRVQVQITPAEAAMLDQARGEESRSDFCRWVIFCDWPVFTRSRSGKFFG